LISFIKRENEYVVPDGSTTINPNDRLFVLTEDKETLARVFNCLGLQYNT
jgi:cell volume regulation protein A